jgi:hypothetical protein
MIVSRRPEGLVLVRQVDHQEQCEAMARLWGNADFVRPEPYAPLVEAARCHDEGWREWEEAPRVDAAGSPVDFADLDRETHVALYREGIAAAERRDPRTGLLVSMHGQGLYEGRRGLDPGPRPPRAGRGPAVREFLAEQDRVQEWLRADIGDGPALEAWASAAYRLLQAWDLLSLYLTWRPLLEGRRMTLAQVPRQVGDSGVDLALVPDGPRACRCAPWPFAVPEAPLPVAARMIPDRRYASDEDLHGALAAAPWTTLELVVRPG